MRSTTAVRGIRWVGPAFALALAAILVAACGSSGGGSADSLAPSGLAGPTGHASASATNSHLAKPGKGKGKKGGATGGSSTAAGGSHSSAVTGSHSSANSGGGGGGKGGSGGGGGRGGGGGGGSHSSSAPPAATCGPPPPSSTPLATVCPTHSDLADGQTVTVYADGFQNSPPVLIFGKKLVVAECVNNSQSTKESDCAPINYNTQMFQPSNGAIGPVQLTVHKTFGKGNNFHDCTKEDCLVAVSQPELKPKFEADVHLHFA